MDNGRGRGMGVEVECREGMGGVVVLGRLGSGLRDKYQCFTVPWPHGAAKGYIMADRTEKEKWNLLVDLSQVHLAGITTTTEYRNRLLLTIASLEDPQRLKDLAEVLVSLGE